MSAYQAILDLCQSNFLSNFGTSIGYRTTENGVLVKVTESVVVCPDHDFPDDDLTCEESEFEYEVRGETPSETALLHRFVWFVNSSDDGVIHRGFLRQKHSSFIGFLLMLEKPDSSLQELTAAFCDEEELV